jgi:lincosamide nucleotidyltransferase B/F
MRTEQYRAFTTILTETLTADTRVVGLVALGSMAEQDYLPDRWSDHDFFVITEPGAQEAFRRDLSWLPDYQRIAFRLREGPHALRVVYDSGHIVEMVVFDASELDGAYANRYRVLIDRGDVAARIAAAAARTAQEAQQSADSDEFNLGMFLVNLLVGAGRYYRGERLSGHTYVKVYAQDHLLRLLGKYVPALQRSLLDNLAPSRRFEQVYPDLGAQLDAIALLPAPVAAASLLDLAQDALDSRMPAFPSADLAVVRRFLAEAASDSATHTKGSP